MCLQTGIPHSDGFKENATQAQGLELVTVATESVRICRARQTRRRKPLRSCFGIGTRTRMQIGCKFVQRCSSFCRKPGTSFKLGDSNDLKRITGVAGKSRRRFRSVSHCPIITSVFLGAIQSLSSTAFQRSSASNGLLWRIRAECTTR